MHVQAIEPGVLGIEGMSSAEIGELAAAGGIVLHELVAEQVSLEEAFMALTQDDVEYRTVAPTGAGETKERIAA